MENFLEMTNKFFKTNIQKKMANRWLHIALNKPKSLSATIYKDIEESIKKGDKDGD